MLLIFIKLPFVNNIFLLSIFEWPLKTGFTVPATVENRRLFCIESVCENNWKVEVREQGSGKKFKQILDNLWDMTIFFL